MSTNKTLPFLAGAFAQLAASTEEAATMGRMFNQMFVTRRRRHSKYMPHQGERECARRRRQMGIE